MNELDSFAIVGHLEVLLEQLYYWAQRAQPSRRDSDDTAAAGRMLTVATTNLEAFVTTLLDYFRPLELTRVRMPMSDLVSAIAMRARADLGAASVTITGGVDGSVSVDVAQFTRALPAILQRLEPRGTALFLAVARSECGGRPGIEIALQSHTKPIPRAPAYGKAELEWALARRIIALHGGEVSERASARGRTMVLFMPADT